MNITHYYPGTRKITRVPGYFYAKTVPACNTRLPAPKKNHALCEFTDGVFSDMIIGEGTVFLQKGVKLNIMNGITELTAELSCGNAPALLFAKQGDEDSRFVRVRFLFAGKPFSAAAAAHTEIRVQKPDGTVTVNDGTVEQGGTALYPLSAQSLTAAGEGKADFLLFGADEELISTVPARLIITPMPVGDEALESVSEYNAFVTEIAAHGSAITALQAADEELQRNIISASSSLGYGIASLSNRLGDMSFSLLTAAQYEALATKSPITLYTVVDGSKVTQYLGETELKSGSVTAGVASIAAVGTSESAQGEITQ